MKIDKNEMGIGSESYHIKSVVNSWEIVHINEKIDVNRIKSISCANKLIPFLDLCSFIYSWTWPWKAADRLWTNWNLVSV